MSGDCTVPPGLAARRTQAAQIARIIPPSTVIMAPVT